MLSQRLNQPLRLCRILFLPSQFRVRTVSILFHTSLYRYYARTDAQSIQTTVNISRQNVSCLVNVGFVRVDPGLGSRCHSIRLKYDQDGRTIDEYATFVGRLTRSSAAVPLGPIEASLHNSLEGGPERLPEMLIGGPINFVQLIKCYNTWRTSTRPAVNNRRPARC